MTTVKWAFNDRNARYDAECIDALIDIEPKRVLPTVLADPKRVYATAEVGDGMYGKCYSFLEYFKNTYAICAPCDIELTIDEQGVANVTKVGSNDPSILGMVFFRTPPHPGTNVLMTICLQYLFFCEEEVLIEQTPPFMDYTLMQQGVTVISGAFDISKWVRPVEVALEIANGVRSVCIPAGTPLTYVRLLPKDGSTVKLVRVEHTAELEKTWRICTKLRTVRPKQPLQQCYAYAKNIVDKFLRPKRCPFGFGKK